MDAVSYSQPPLLSIVIPALRNDLELRRCVDSVRLAIDGQIDAEVLLVVPAPLLPVAEQQFPGVRVIAESRSNVYAAMNDGVAASRGRYLYFLGKDDILLPSAQAVFRALETSAPSVVFAAVYWGALGQRSTRSSRWGILLRNVCHQGIVYSREALLSHGPYVRRFRVRADHLLNIRVLWDDAMQRRKLYLNTPIAWYAASGLSSVVADRAFYRVQPVLIERYVGCFWAVVWRIYKRLRPEKGMW